jgi:hypothetical protein
MALDTRKIAVGDKVASNVNAQGMRLGEIFTVVEIVRKPYAFGTFTELVVARSSGERFSIGNPHLVLNAVEKNWSASLAERSARSRMMTREEEQAARARLADRRLTGRAPEHKVAGRDGSPITVTIPADQDGRQAREREIPNFPVGGKK